MNRLVMTPFSITMTNLALRSMQLSGSIVALSTLAASFSTVVDTQTNKRMSLGSHEVTFFLLVVYSSMMFSLWSVACVEMFPLVVRPRPQLSRLIDGLMCVFLTAAGLALVGSDYVLDCDAYGGMLKCRNLTTAVVFDFLTILPLIGTFMFSYVTSTSEIDFGSQYCVEITPSGLLSPMDAFVIQESKS